MSDLEHVPQENPGGWLFGAIFALLIGVEFALFSIAGDMSYWIVASPLLVFSVYLFRRAWTARRDLTILRAQELAGGVEHTHLRTRRQLEHIRSEELRRKRDLKLSHEAMALLKEGDTP